MNWSCPPQQPPQLSPRLSPRTSSKEVLPAVITTRFRGLRGPAMRVLRESNIWELDLSVTGVLDRDDRGQLFVPAIVRAFSKFDGVPFTLGRHARRWQARRNTA